VYWSPGTKEYPGNSGTQQAAAHRRRPVVTPHFNQLAFFNSRYIINLNLLLNRGLLNIIRTRIKEAAVFGSRLAPTMWPVNGGRSDHPDPDGGLQIFERIIDFHKNHTRGKSVRNKSSATACCDALRLRAGTVAVGPQQ